MKACENKVLAFGSLLMVSLAAVGGLRCHACVKIFPDNTCWISDVCEVPDSKFCFTQRISRGGHIMRLRRGCTSTCISTVNLRHSYIRKEWCCRTDFCNRFNVWLPE